MGSHTQLWNGVWTHSWIGLTQNWNALTHDWNAFTHYWHTLTLPKCSPTHPWNGISRWCVHEFHLVIREHFSTFIKQDTTPRNPVRPVSPNLPFSFSELLLMLQFPFLAHLLLLPTCWKFHVGSGLFFPHRLLDCANTGDSKVGIGPTIGPAMTKFVFSGPAPVLTWFWCLIDSFCRRRELGSIRKENFEFPDKSSPCSVKQQGERLIWVSTSVFHQVWQKRPVLTDTIRLRV